MRLAGKKVINLSFSQRFIFRGGYLGFLFISDLYQNMKVVWDDWSTFTCMNIESQTNANIRCLPIFPANIKYLIPALTTDLLASLKLQAQGNKWRKGIVSVDYTFENYCTDFKFHRAGWSLLNFKTHLFANRGFLTVFQWLPLEYIQNKIYLFENVGSFLVVWL